jgi:asparagine synthase (glutamine-hydrolysing)
VCGISGIIGRHKPEDKSLVTKMNNIQNHRGPDASSIKQYKCGTLGHTRLSVIDLSDRSIQPMESIDERYSIVFNGEIYNYKELRKELSLSYKFKTQSDTEVLLSAYIVWGEKCLEKINGMFAFCILDSVNGNAFMARDRFGQKPFCFMEESDRLLFASEIKALLAAGVRAEADNNTWARYLNTASYDDTDETFFKNILQLRPGECAIWQSGKGLTRYFYYRLEDEYLEKEQNLDDAIQEIQELLLNSAKIHMRSDVPVGVSLSGGLDSSALLACIDHIGKLHKGVNCVSVDFGGDLSEEEWITAAADFHNLPSNILNYTPNEFHDSLKPMMWHLEGPIGGLMNCALSNVMRKFKSIGTVVVQDGTGLDEAFAGYRNHHNLYLGSLIKDNDVRAEKAIKEYANNWNVSEKEAVLCGINEIKRKGTAIDGTIPVKPELLNSQFIDDYYIDRQSFNKTNDPIKRELVNYLQTAKIPRNTRMKDRLSMAYSLELRLPFLDHRLVEAALSLPSEFYFLYGRSKSIVREAMKGIMSDSVRLAVKRSIQAPQGEWLRKKPMSDYINDLIHSGSFASRGIFNEKKCQNIFKEFCQGEFDNSFFVWQWINTEEWFRVFIDNSSSELQYNLFTAN